MLLSLAAGALFALAGVQQFDTTIAVERGQRLEVNNFAGEISVQAWNRNAVRVQASMESRSRVEVSVSSPEIQVRTTGHRGSPGQTDFVISAPPWMDLELAGVHTDVRVRGAQGGVRVETVEGDVEVNGGNGLVALQSVQGGISLRAARGRINVSSVNEGIEVQQSAGEISAETVNGDVDLRRVEATSVEASTVNGDMNYDGPIRGSGPYSFQTHNGDITVAVAEGTSAMVSVSTFSGEFESEFPVRIVDTRKGRRFSFVLGNGGAGVNLESFQGTIRLVRPGSRRLAEDHDRDEDEE